MMRTIRSWFGRLLSTELGVLGDRVNALEATLAALSEDYSAFKETTTRFQKRTGMRWARSNGSGEDDLVAQLKQALQARSNDPFAGM